MATLLDQNESPELNQVQQLAQLPQGLAIMKMENDSIMALAAAHPRDLKKIKAELSECLTEFPAQANDMIYSKPVGWQEDECKDCGKKCKRQNKKNPTKKCWSCKSENIKLGGERFARGLSVRAAELLAEAYGHNKVSSRVDPVDDDTVRIGATFTDFQKGRIWVQESLLSKWYKSWDQKMVRHSDDKFLSLVCAAQASKCVREVVNRSVNSALKAWLFDECEKLIETNLTDDKIEEIVVAFAKHEVTKDMLENLIGKTAAMGWSVEDRKTLMGVWNGIKSGEMSIAELFPKEESDRKPDDRTKPQADTNGNGSTSTSDALKFPNGKKAEAPEEKKPEQPKGSPDFEIWATKIAKAGSDSALDEIANGISEALEIQSITKAEFDQLTQAINDRSKKLNE